ncbi:MAG: folate-binding protein [Lacunisphaera sp.]
MIYYLQDSHLNDSSAVLRVRGPDANTYLQGQFTQDLRLAAGESAYGLWLDQKGKVQADSQVLKQAENEYLIACFSCKAADLRSRLERYLIADEVELEDLTESWTGVLLWGEGAASIVPPAGAIALPSRRAGPGSRQWLVPAGSTAAIRSTLGDGAVAADRAAAELARLRAAIPAVPVDIGPRDLPNEGGLDDGAISCTKGCYLGQEVMARLKNLGQVRRRLHVVRGVGPVPAAGTALYQGERKVGETRSAAADGDGFLAMAMLSLVNLDAAAGLAFTPGGGANLEILQRV